MKKCPFCAEEIQDEAIVCRFCGKDLRPEIQTEPEQPRYERANITAGGISKAGCNTILILIAIIIIGVLIANAQGGSVKPTPNPNGERIGAANACQNSIRTRLKAPSTASFQNASEAKVSSEDNKYAVSSYVDSENSFGAKIRLFYTCSITYSAGIYTIDDVFTSEE